MIVDLSRFLNNQTTIYPGTVLPSIEDSNTIEKDGFAEKKLTIPSHFGTHIDAPSHILEAGKNLDEFKLLKFIGKAKLIDVEGYSEISMDTLTRIENIERLDFLIFKTGWEHLWNSPSYFEGFPILTNKASQYIAKLRIKGVGFDAISPDRVGDEVMSNHKILLENEILIIENLCNLGSLPASEFNFQCLPLKIENADGSPVRAIAEFA